MSDLLPCPFCGFQDTEPPHPRLRECRDGNQNDPSFWIECDSCLCNGPMSGKGIDSRAQWNRRQPYLPPADLETLRMIAERLYADGPGTVTKENYEPAIRAIIARCEGKP